MDALESRAAMGQMLKTQKTSFLDRLLGRGPKASAATQLPAATRPFQAISIFRGTQACVMAKRFNEHRFLAKDAPQLPLQGCTMCERCDCRYVKHKDRRSDPRRMVDFGCAPMLFCGGEKRAALGRRATDKR